LVEQKQFSYQILKEWKFGNLLLEKTIQDIINYIDSKKFAQPDGGVKKRPCLLS